jgi:predicted phage terminase large subunit-like protein
MRSDQDVHVICLPMRFDPTHPYIHPDDPRKEEGELLWPSRWPDEEVEKYEQRPTEFAAQFQQRPLPPGGLLLLDAYLSHRYDALPGDLKRTIEKKSCGQGEQWITAWDLTFKGKKTSDWVVGQVWCRYKGQYYIVDQVRRQCGYLDTKQLIREIRDTYPWIRKHIIEDAANAPAIVEDLEREIPGLKLEPHGGGVLARTQQVEGVWATGAVRIPASASWIGGADGFVAEHLAYDGLGTRHDDQVSASSLALLHLSSKKSTAWVDAMKKAGRNM